MARRLTRKEQWEAAERPVQVMAAIRAETLLRFDDCAQRIGLSRETALQEAVRDWMLARECSHNRQDRLALERALRDAKDRAPVEELLERFRTQMEKVSHGPLTRPREVAKVPTMHRLKAILDDEGRRQSWLAERIGKDAAEVSRYAKGMVPPEGTRQAIADVLRRAPADIWPELYAEAA